MPESVPPSWHTSRRTWRHTSWHSLVCKHVKSQGPHREKEIGEEARGGPLSCPTTLTQRLCEGSRSRQRYRRMPTLVFVLGMLCLATVATASAPGTPPGIQDPVLSDGPAPPDK